MIRLTLYSRPGCELCEEMRQEVDVELGAEAHEWDVVNVDESESLASKWGETIPVLFVNGRLFAKVRLPRLAAGLRLRRAAARAGR